MKIYYNPILKEKAHKLRANPTYAEKVLWNALKGKQMMGYDFHRQKLIGNYIYDFYCFKLKLVIEVDGISHDEDEVKMNDKLKDMYIESIGFNILRFIDEEVLGNRRLVIEKIEGYIKDFNKNY